jgi:two-component system, NtrC family, sensor histidine kinase HydH
MVASANGRSVKGRLTMAPHSTSTPEATAIARQPKPLPEFHVAQAGVTGSSSDWPRRGMILAAVGLVGVLQFVTPLSATHWIYIIQRMYYIPIVLAGLSLGLRDGLATALLSAVAFMCGTPSIWTVPRVDVLDQCLEAGVFCLVGGVAGGLTDRRRKQDRALRETTEQLRRAHQELRENFEGMKRAERLSALGQMSAGLAHEIRNPLASIEGAAAVVQRERNSEERRREFLEIIQKESRRLNQLLTNFLHFARPSPPDLKMVEIDGLFDSVMILAQHAGDTRKWELKKEMPPGMPPLECDPEQIKQVLLNLVMNAFQASPQGGIVMLTARREGNRVAIEVHDQGCGISEGSLDRIFDPFFTTKENGTGLGLSLAHQIVSQHGGSLTVARNSFEGATMRVLLPWRSNPT